MNGVSFYAGVHIGHDLGRRFRLEGFLVAGPAFGEFIYSYILKNNQYYGDSGLEFSSEISQELTGKGKGFAMDGGVQLFFNPTRYFRVFLAGVYSHQQVKSLSGLGWQNIFAYPEPWEGDIYLIKEPQSTPWCYEEITCLSNNEFLLEYYKERSMKLNLSGFSIHIGIAFRL
jgi:hypothetical protein